MGGVVASGGSGKGGHYNMGGNTSNGGASFHHQNSMHGGYISGGGIATDNESARLSNVQTYKYNSLQKAAANSILTNKSAIRKIAPDGSRQPLPKSRERNMPGVDYSGVRGRNAQMATEQQKAY